MENDLISRSALLDDLRGCYDDLIRVYDSLRYVPERQICGAQISELKNVVYWVNNAPAVDAVEVGSCEGCYWKEIGRQQKCSCCRRNRHMKDNFCNGGTT